MIRCLARRAALACLAVGSLGPGVAAAAAQHSRIEEAVRTSTLDNGLEVIVVEDRAVPLATVLVAVRNGSFTQEPSDEGLAHLYEHLLFRTYDGGPRAFWQAMRAVCFAFIGDTTRMSGLW
jgi:predicted Zn-dependent peptidase